jgi:hypothetical protein
MSAPALRVAYTARQVADMFGTDGTFWLDQGVRDGRYPHLRLGGKRLVRFTDAHIAEIARLTEQQATAATTTATTGEATTPKPEPGQVFALSQRSATRRRNRR